MTYEGILQVAQSMFNHIKDDFERHVQHYGDTWRGKRAVSKNSRNYMHASSCLVRRSESLHSLADELQDLDFHKVTLELRDEILRCDNTSPEAYLHAQKTTAHLLDRYVEHTEEAPQST